MIDTHSSAEMRQQFCRGATLAAILRHVVRATPGINEIEIIRKMRIAFRLSVGEAKPSALWMNGSMSDESTNEMMLPPIVIQHDKWGCANQSSCWIREFEASDAPFASKIAEIRKTVTRDMHDYLKMQVAQNMQDVGGSKLPKELQYEFEIRLLMFAQCRISADLWLALSEHISRHVLN